MPENESIRRQDLLIVGGGPAALATARGYREAGGAGEVLIISADRHPPYLRPPLTKDYLRGEIEASELPMVDEDWYNRHAVTLWLRSTVVGLELSTRRVRVEREQGVTEVEYGELVLATGSSPAPLPIRGADLPGVIYVRDRASAEQMRTLRGKGKRVVVIGSGFIGCEAAASLAATGADVVLVTEEPTPHQGRLGTQAGDRIAGWLSGYGVQLRTGDGAREIEGRGKQWVVTSADGTRLRADGVISGSGARPNVELAERAGLEVADGAVVVDSSMRASDPRVRAVGDIARAENDDAGRALRVEHWGEAETMGEIAGRCLAGEDESWAQAPGFWSEIGTHTLKYAAWGDGYEDAVLVDRDQSDPGEPGWAVWYGRGGELVGVLTSEWDEAYEHGQELVECHADFDRVLQRYRPAEPASGNPSGER